MLSDHVGRPCRYCGAPMTAPTRDHMRPRSRLGAPLGAINVTFACEACNGEKGDRTLVEFLAVLVERADPRAHRVAGVIQSLCARGHHHVCGDRRG